MLQWRWGRKQKPAFDVRAERDVAAKHFGARHWRRAFAAYGRLAEHDPSDCFVQIRLGDCARQLRKTGAAETAYRTAMAGYSRACDWTKAAAACRLLVALRPKDHDLRLHLASLESQRRLGATGYTPEQVSPVLIPRAPGDIELRGWSDERPFDHWAGLDIDIRGRSRPVQGVGARAEAEGRESTRIQRGAMRVPPPVTAPVSPPTEMAPVPESSDNDAMPEAVFEELYGSLSSSGIPVVNPSFDTTLRHAAMMRTPRESEFEAQGGADEDELCSCGRCHICRPTRKFATL